MNIMKRLEKKEVPTIMMTEELTNIIESLEVETTNWDEVLGCSGHGKEYYLSSYLVRDRDQMDRVLKEIQKLVKLGRRADMIMSLETFLRFENYAHSENLLRDIVKFLKGDDDAFYTVDINKFREFLEKQK